MPSGVEVARENVRKFSDYWNGLRAKGKYLPLKQDGTIWVEKVAGEAGVGKSALRQNPMLKELYKGAVSETFDAHKKAVEAQLDQEAGQRARKVETASLAALAGSGAERDKVKKLEKRVADLEKQLAVLNVAHQQAMERLKQLEYVEREKERLRLLVERYEFQTDNAINPGPY
jgi:hypothetical protein